VHDDVVAEQFPAGWRLGLHVGKLAASLDATLVVAAEFDVGLHALIEVGIESEDHVIDFAALLCLRQNTCLLVSQGVGWSQAYVALGGRLEGVSGFCDCQHQRIENCFMVHVHKVDLLGVVAASKGIRGEISLAELHQVFSGNLT